MTKTMRAALNPVETLDTATTATEIASAMRRRLIQSSLMD